MKRLLLTAAALVCLTGCQSPEEKYRAELEAHLEKMAETGVSLPEEVPMLTRRLKEMEVAKMGGRADLDDIHGQPGDDPEVEREVKESFVAYYNMPYGAEGERAAWIRFMRAIDRADELRKAKATPAS